ncbi:hypothetical protein [Duganella sp. HH101]|uniref:hypothetical protein n=1 Tax=Duganella sp. HH101 TaxID=1781066 RepID=UPI00114CB569|nr:hypothetical protein [Duganella sp. HH101]
MNTAFEVVPTAAAWTKGWTLTRGKAAPVSQPYGYKIDLGVPECLERHAMVDYDTGVVRALTDRLHTVALDNAAAVAPDGYQLSLSTSGAVSDAELRDVNGELAARGRVAHSDGVATFDQTAAVIA